MASYSLALKLLDLIPEESVSVHKLVRQTGFDHRTIKKYLDLITRIQGSKRIVKVQEGLRVLVRKENLVTNP